MKEKAPAVRLRCDPKSPPGLADRLAAVCDACIECGKCVSECGFLGRCGTPVAIASAGDPEDPEFLKMAYECTLCGLCGAVCPVNLEPGALFLEMRRAAVARGIALDRHAPILAYEKRGTSSRYTWYSLPENADTVFFPGCTLPGTRPDRTLALYEHLKTVFPAIGIVLDCCGKPSHDLGRMGWFEDMFAEMTRYLSDHGIKRVIVACPNCYKVFSEYGASIAVITVYEILAQHGWPTTEFRPAAPVTVHDPCVLRDQDHIHAAVRRLVKRLGFRVEEMTHHSRKTLCCGEGGAVACVDKDLSGAWKVRRQKETGGRPVVAYCAGCANALKGAGTVAHLIDMLYDPGCVATGRTGAARAPMTYLNRLRVKRRLKANEKAAATRERRYRSPFAPSGAPRMKKWAVLALVAALAVGLHIGAADHIRADALRGWVASWGALAPVIYMLIYAAAPVFFLPGLPITLAGGILFGPFWGVVYAISGATTGACAAFLVSRYIARDWIARRLKGPRWSRLDDGVERHGWKIVAFTRLVPLFPFNLLNYAFGLTRIRFVDYAVTTFFCMLPACIAFIVFSSSLPDLLSGRISKEFLAGAALIAAVSAIPILYRRYRMKKGLTTDLIK